MRASARRNREVESRPLKTQCQQLNSCEDFVIYQASCDQDESRKTCCPNIQSFGVASACPIEYASPIAG
jgi:hypothetical protein